MQLGISLKGQNFTSSLVENDISSSMQLTKDRPYLIFWLGQVCFDAVKARQNDQVLCWTSDRYFLPSYWAASFGEGSESSTLLQGEMATRQAGRKEQIANPWRKFGTREDNGRFVCWGFVVSYCSRILPCWFWGSLRKSYQLCLTKPLLPLDR